MFGADTQSIELLQDWFGYCLTGSTNQQKAMILVGPKRSGKGTVGRVLTRLIGKANVCGPTTATLASQFGLADLVTKPLAIVSDARFSGEHIQTVVERLLAITGEDTITVERKYKDPVNVKLPTRFMFLTNELPELRDAAGALVGRFMMLRFTQSFYGHEDIGLTERLCAELPGILNWAITGWRRLAERGHFVQPASVEEALQEMADLSSPVAQFVRECCEVDQRLWVWTSAMYAAWTAWCQADGRVKVSTAQRFGRDLNAAFPGIRTRQSTNGPRFYEGIALRTPGSDGLEVSQ